MTLGAILISFFTLLLLISVWKFMKIPIHDLNPPRLLKAISLIFFALYPLIIQHTDKFFPKLLDEQHVNIALFLVAFWILISAEIKEVSIVNADRKKLNSVKTTADATQRTVNSIEDIWLMKLKTQ